MNQALIFRAEPSPGVFEIGFDSGELEGFELGELAFDLSGADLDRIAAVVRDYCRQGGQLSQIPIERTNNAVHVGVGSVRDC
jgi:hypothetical protein